MSELVIDLSHHNIIPESLKPAYDFGVRGLIHKVTEGTSFTDSKVKARYSMVYNTLMLWGLYHFIRPGDIEEQADYFIKQSRSVMDDNTLLAVDYEDSKVSLNDVHLFLLLVEEQTHRKPIIYSGHVLKDKMMAEPLSELTQYKLWLAHYALEPSLPKGWDKYFLWQYTDDGQVPGVNPPTDMNNFNGSLSELQAQWSGRDYPIEQTVVEVTVPAGVRVEVKYK